MRHLTAPYCVFAKWELESTISVINSGTFRIWTSRQYMQVIIGAGQPKLSGMRPRTASYWVFAEMRPCCRIVMDFGILLHLAVSESRSEVSLVQRDNI